MIKISIPEFEKREFGDIESAVEYLTHRPQGNITVNFGDIADALRYEYVAKIYKATGIVLSPSDACREERDRFVDRVERVLGEKIVRRRKFNPDAIKI